MVLGRFHLEIIVIICIAGFWGVGYYTLFVWMAYFLTTSSLNSCGAGFGGAAAAAAGSLEDGSGNAIENAWWIVFVGNALLVAGLPLGGYLGDWVGKKISDYRGLQKGAHVGGLDVSRDQQLGFRVVMALGASLMVVVALPAFALITTCNTANAALAQLLFVISMSLFGGNLPALMLDLFPLELRYSGVGIAYNVAHGGY